MRNRLPLLVVLLASPSLGLQDARVWTVDSSGNGDFAELQLAVDAAGPGDVIHVLRHVERDGCYRGFHLIGKGVSIYADLGGEWTIGPSRIEGLPAGESVTLSGLGFQIPAANTAVGEPTYGEAREDVTTLAIHDCAGAVRLETCALANASTYYSRYASVLELRYADDVSLHDCMLFGGPADARSELADPMHACVDLKLSTLEMHDCRVEGRDGRYGNCDMFCFCEWGGTGAIGVHLRGAGSTLRASGCEILGGDAGLTDCLFDMGLASPGLRVGSGSTAFLRETVVLGGVGGFGAQDAPDIVGTATISAEPHRSLRADAMADVDGELDVELEGEPGEFAWLHVGLEGTREEFDLETGAALVRAGGSLRRIALGPLDQEGGLAADVALPLPAAKRARRYLVQAVFSRPGRVRFGASAVVHVLGPGGPLHPPGSRVHVDATASHGGWGHDWAGACADLYDAVRRVVGRDPRPTEVWIRAGRYVVAGTTLQPNDPLRLRPGMVLRGGFEGTETSLDERVAGAARSLLTADVLGDDGPRFANRDDNAGLVIARDVIRHGLDGDPPAVLDHLAIEGVNPQSPPYSYYPSVDLPPRSEMTWCSLRSNRTGRALVSSEGPCTLRNVSFRENRAHRTLACWVPSLWPIRVDDVVVVENCEWVGNAECRNLVETVWFPLWMSSSTVTNNVLDANGVAVYTPHRHREVFRSRIVGSIVFNNSSAGDRSEDAQLGHSTAGDPADHVEVVGSCIGGWSGRFGGTGNHGLDPRFRDPLGPDGVAGTLDDDVRLGAGSPCVDAGVNSEVAVAVDLDGRPRFADDPNVPDTGVGTPPIVDMGAHER